MRQQFKLQSFHSPASFTPAAVFGHTGIVKRTVHMLVAAICVFGGALIADSVFGDGIEPDDINRALMLAVIAGIVRYWATREKTQ